MFERSAEFPVAFAPWVNLDPDQAVRLAVGWWREQPGEHLVLFHAKSMLQNNNILARLVRETRGARVESYQTLRRSSWRGGPVLAPWPSEKVLGALDDDLAPPSAVAIMSGAPPTTTSAPGSLLVVGATFTPTRSPAQAVS